MAETPGETDTDDNLLICTVAIGIGFAWNSGDLSAYGIGSLLEQIGVPREVHNRIALA